jgi:hypothetical protein
MALDRFVYWKTKRRPTRDEIGTVVEDFFKGFGAEIEWRTDRYFIKLPGEITHPFDRIVGARKHPAELTDAERWIEVWPDPDDACIDVMTRQQDEVTNVLAEGLAQLFARFWDGRRDIDFLGPEATKAMRILVEGLKYHEHDGHNMPKKVAREALEALGVEPDDQP